METLFTRGRHNLLGNFSYPNKVINNKLTCLLILLMLSFGGAFYAAAESLVL